MPGDHVSGEEVCFQEHVLPNNYMSPLSCTCTAEPAYLPDVAEHVAEMANVT